MDECVSDSKKVVNKEELTPEELKKLEEEQGKPVSLSQLAGQIKNRMYSKTKDVV